MSQPPSPSLMKAQFIRADLVAMRMSAASASAKPPPAAAPCTSAMIGCGQRRIADIVMLMRRCPQPIVALVQGAAAGGGFALALASDIRIAATSARMNCAFIKLGLGGCDIGTSYFLPRLVGVSIASELILTGRFIGAERALAVGLVSEVVEDDGLEAAAEPYLDAMMTASPVGLRLSKECLNMSVDAGSIEAVIAMEDRNQVLCSRSDEFNEGIRAFLEKRKPVYIKR